MKVLITGINGFIAGELASYFLKKNIEVFGSYHKHPCSRFELAKQYHLYLPSEEVYSIIKSIKPDYIIHTAGTASVNKSVRNPYLDFSLSVPATAILLDAIKQYSPTTKFLFLSSAAVYGNPESLPISENHPIKPISPYGFHKWMGEQLCKEYFELYGISSKIVRIFSAYGTGLKRQVIYDLAKKIVDIGNQLTPFDILGTGKESRDFIFETDVAKGIEIIMQDDSLQFDVFNLSSGKETSIKDLVDSILKIANKNYKYNFTGNTRKGDPINWKADISKIKSIGFLPTVNLEDGLRKIIQEIHENIN